MLKKMLGEGPKDTKLLLVDDLTPEDTAMLQALYSRSAESAETHIEKLYADRQEHVWRALMSAGGLSEVQCTELAVAIDKAYSGHASEKARRLMEKYFVGYGHRSIGDCGTTTFFVENVSLLAAKAIQDNPLYSGQETSTRYIDMSKQRIVDPVGTEASARILQRWMDFYVQNQERVKSEVRRRHPRLADETTEAYEGAVKARTFDILRGFLPAGICTQLSWHTNLRQFGDNIGRLLCHSSLEIGEIGRGLMDLASERYPSSLQVIGASDHKVRKWVAELAFDYAYTAQRGTSAFFNGVRRASIDYYKDVIQRRPRGERLPHWMSDFGQFTWRFELDFGSFRDIQRQRNGVCRMPLLTLERGFESWYLEQLDSELAKVAIELLNAQEHDIANLDTHWSEVDRQYYIPLGYKVPCEVMYTLPVAVYVMELRSGKMVHPTLRKVVHGMIRDFLGAYPGFMLHVDMDPDSWSVRRGLQTIKEKAQ